MKRHILYTVIILVVLILQVRQSPLVAQEMDPEIQKLTQDLIRWTQEQFEKYGSVDQQKLDSMNQVIRLRQQELAEASKKSEPVADSLSASGTKKIIDMIQGSALTVPSGKTWKIRRVTCKSGIGEYAILVTSVKFKDAYQEKENITMPAFTPEASLLTDDTSSIIYTFEIVEFSTH